MKQKKQSIIVLLLCLLFLFPFPTVMAKADMGPKPSVRIAFENVPAELCYGTLLSKSPSTGPASAWDGKEENGLHSKNDEYYLDYDIWKAFVEYKDSDGYYFLQNSFEVSKTGNLNWTYYPPSPFKILLYYPQKNIFVVSDIYERYAFDSYYTVDLGDLHIESLETNVAPVLLSERLVAEYSYDYTHENIAFLVRVLITVALELAIALLFGLREKKQLIYFGIVNTFTQVVLNFLLNVVNYASGRFALIANYFLLETIVFAVEGVLYALFANKFAQKQRKKSRYVVYAFVANVSSFVFGMVMALAVPWFF